LSLQLASLNTTALFWNRMQLLPTAPIASQTQVERHSIYTQPGLGWSWPAETFDELHMVIPFYPFEK